MDKQDPRNDLFVGLGVPERGIVALCGGGGKTTLMYRLAAQAVSRGVPVACATTTKVFLPHIPDEVRAVLLEENDDLASGLRIVPDWPVFLAAGDAGKNDSPKLRGLAPETLDSLSRLFPDILFIVEADGAAQKPLKAPAAHEPVFPADTALTVAVIGLDAVNIPFDPEQVHRPERVSTLTGLARGDTVTLEAMRILVTHPLGLLQHCPAASRRVIFGNKADVIPTPDKWPWAVGSALQGWCL